MELIKASCCIIGTVLIQLTFGTFYSYGNVFPYVASYMRANDNMFVSTEHGLWLTAAFLLGQGISVVLGSYLEQSLGSRVAIIVGCSVHTTSTLLTIKAINISLPAVILIYGFASGLGSGCGYMASIIAAQRWFPAQKGLFTGLILAGFGFGGLIFTNLQTLYMNPNNLGTDLGGYYPKEVYEKVPSLFLYMGIIFAVSQTVGCMLAFTPPPSDSHGHNPGTESVKSPAKSPAESSRGNVTMHEGLPEIRTYLGALKTRAFVVIAFMMVLTAPGVTFVNSLGKRYGQLYSEDDQYLAFVVAFASIANAGGRLTWGYLVDKYPFSTCFTCTASIFAFLIALFPFGFILASKYMYFFWMFGLFFGFAGGFVLMPVYIEQVFGSKFSGFVYGSVFILFALSSILTSFIIQSTIGPVLSDENKSSDDKFYIRTAPCLIISLSYLSSVVLFYSALPVRRYENAILRRKENEIMRHQRSVFNRADLYPIERGTLAEKQAALAIQNVGNNNDEARRENSLGSIVKFSSANDDRGVRTFAQPNVFKVI